jgi:DNA-binding NtrC family response regulator
MSPDPGRLLVVEDDVALLELLRVELEDSGLEVTTVRSAEAALDALGERAVDLVVSDLRLPGSSGLDLLAEVRSMEPRPAFVVITAFGTIDQAVSCLKEGADDFLTKPLDLDHLSVRVARVLEHRRITRELLRYREALGEPDFHRMIGRSPAMTALFAELRRVAQGHGPVLIQGESGVGKELAARAVHAESDRADGPFLAVNCAGIPEALLESEFFGHVAGAFTGAAGDRPGLFREADGGTLLLDEIGEMPAGLQAKLLRVLEEGEVRPVGSDRNATVDVRVLAATNRDLAADSDTLRRDLYYRLETFRISVPPLREREGDVDLLTVRFIQRHAARLGKEPPEPSPGAMKRLRSYPFPGNVRELENLVERAVTYCNGPVIDERHLPGRLRDSPVAAPGDHPENGEKRLLAGDMLPSLRALGNRYVRLVLERVDGNKRRAAALLGISRRTLYRRLEDETV